MESMCQRLNVLRKVDNLLMAHKPNNSTGVKRFILEFLFFGLINARSCLFAGFFFLALFLVPAKGIMGIPRLVFAVTFQALLIRLKLETWDELKAICVFHLVGFMMELFKTSASISSWQYPDAAFTKLWEVPQFTGFMYAAVGSYIIQSWRFFKVRIEHYPPYWMATLVALAIYINFFSHHYIDDYRWYLTAFIFGLYARGTIFYTPLDQECRMPLLLAFILIGFFIWLAENFGTFFGIWQYPNQLGAWSVVHAGKWGAWSLLVVVTFTIVVHLKHIKANVAIAR